jgi:hypothetical protein
MAGSGTTTAPLLRLRFALKRDGTPVLSVTRRDGSVAWQRQTHFFPVHDLTHYAIESVLGLRQAFWGTMADGWDFGDFGSPWPRGRMPNEPQALLAECIAGFLDRAALTGQDDAASLNAHVAELFAQRGMAPPRTVTDAEFARIREMRRELAARWHALPAGEAFELEFPAD